jgi:hypothetical protein
VSNCSCQDVHLSVMTSLHLASTPQLTAQSL